MLGIRRKGRVVYPSLARPVLKPIKELLFLLHLEVGMARLDGLRDAGPGDIVLTAPDSRRIR